MSEKTEAVKPDKEGKKDIPSLSKPNTPDHEQFAEAFLSSLATHREPPGMTPELAHILDTETPPPPANPRPRRTITIT